MPGAFAHITLVNTLKESHRLEAIPNFPRQVIPWILQYFKFTELGAVSPDYPYLSITDGKSKKWADSMHHIRSGEMIHAGVAQVEILNSPAKEKCLAWLLGYTAHVVADVTIHPVVELKVGPYEGNEKHHRICEMNQDTYIFNRLNLGNIGLSEHLDSGIWACREKETDLIDKDISSLWSSMLQHVYPDEFTNNPPKIDGWHQSFNFMVDKIGEEGNKLLPLARHVAVDCGLTYPNYDEIDHQYIRGLKTPGGTMDYDQIFDKAIGHVGYIWSLVTQGALSNSQDYKSKVDNWDLDTGRDQNGKLAFWS